MSELTFKSALIEKMYYGREANRFTRTKMIFAATEKGKTMRLIDADALIEATNNFCDGYKVNWNDRKVIAWINGAPTIDAVPVVHGRWIRIFRGNYECSVCGCIPYYAGNINTLNYCPNCGAKMDGGNDG